MTTKTIYGLVDPFTDEIRYIGQTTNRRKRLCEHLCETGNAAKTQWVGTLLSSGVKPKMVILEEVDGDDADDAERRWIWRGRKCGWRLFNIYPMHPTGAKQKMISIYPVDEATLHQIGKDEGLATFSATLRWLINDWQRMKAQQTEALVALHARYVTEQPR